MQRLFLRGLRTGAARRAPAASQNLARRNSSGDVPISPFSVARTDFCLFVVRRSSTLGGMPNNRASHKAPKPLSTDPAARERPACPVCGQPSYSIGGVHPQCSQLQNDPAHTKTVDPAADDPVSEQIVASVSVGGDFAAGGTFSAVPAAPIACSTSVRWDDA